jgi:hypothetical protein
LLGGLSSLRSHLQQRLRCSLGGLSSRSSS